jgi:putative transposase
VTFAAVDDLTEARVGMPIQAACAVMGVPRATWYRRRHPGPDTSAPGASGAGSRPTPPNALSAAERQEILAVLGSDRFVDKSVAQTWATLLDDGVYLASMSTMHRILRAAGQARRRGRAATHPPRTRPELMATAPVQVWSWDITKLKGPGRCDYYDLYVILDIYSRYVVDYTVAATEDGELATELIDRAIAVHGRPHTIHADRGTSMTSKPVAQLLVDLGVTRSHSRPHVSNDNPYSEAAFKTLKHAPAFPERFGSLTDARAFCDDFFTYYNHEHRHSGIGWHTPASVHHGTATQIRAHRAQTLTRAYHAHPDRFRHRPPQPPKIPTTAWINDPSKEALVQNN